MSIEAMAAAAVGAIAPYLAKGPEKAAERMGAKAADGAGKLLGRLRERLTGHAREALGDLEAAPADEDGRAALRLQLKKALTADPALAADLERLLADMPATVQTMTQTGEGHKGAQVAGSGNTVKIN